MSRLRRFLHRRYVRALVTGLSATALACAASASLLEIRHEVSFGAVYRYFSRPHSKRADLSRPLRHPATTAQLVGLFAAESGTNPGGLVYLEGDALAFYPHLTSRSRDSLERLRAKEALFERLAPLYLRADLEGLLRELETPQARTLLDRGGVSRAEIAALREELAEVAGRIGRMRLLRRAGRHLLHFVPYHREPYELDFAEKLRFYERNDPEGDFVGLYEVYGLRRMAAEDEAYAHELSAASHYIVIGRTPDNLIRVRDFHGGRSRQYLIAPLLHPSGMTLFRVTSHGTSSPG